MDELCKTKVRRNGELVEEPGLYVEPVQLQVVCLRLWEKYHTGGPIGEDLVRGGSNDVDSALADFYEHGIKTATEKFPRLTERRIRDWCEQRLITGQGTRGQVQEGDETEPSLPSPVIGALIDSRIVRAEERRNTKWFELAHDRLIGPVRKSNSGWRNASLQPWQLKAELWVKNEPRELLLSGRELEEAKVWETCIPMK